MKYKKRTHCEVCEKKLGKPLIDLPNLPLTECLFKKPTKPVLVDQQFYVCEFCGHGQLGTMISSKTLYKDYFYKTSKGLNKKSNDRIISMIKDAEKFDTIIDIGCNDLYLLKLLKKNAKRLIGIDFNVKSDDKKIEVINKPVEDVNWKELLKGRVLVISIHNLEHLEHPKKLIKEMLKYANIGTKFYMEFPCLEELVNNNRFDQIFHHHLHYFTSHSLETMIDSVGGISYENQFVHGNWGSLRVLFKKKIFNINGIKEKYNDFKKHMKQKSKEIKTLDKNPYAYGAILTLPVLNYHLDGALDNVKYIIDIDKSKNNLFYSGTLMQIKDTKDLSNKDVIITALGFSDNIKKSLKKLKTRKIIELI